MWFYVVRSSDLKTLGLVDSSDIGGLSLVLHRGIFFHHVRTRKTLFPCLGMAGTFTTELNRGVGQWGLTG
jgi:hypothetical protein